ncbi:MAG: glycoside hydrolase family 9 protein [Candidatus Eisenbacteria sp.]|nr:glycoside hydrolase family 9 protein [Candidatus Eisenbacteria bacterium]
MSAREYAARGSVSAAVGAYCSFAAKVESIVSAIAGGLLALTAMLGSHASAIALRFLAFTIAVASLAFGITVGGLGAAGAGASHIPTSSQESHIPTSSQELRATIPVTEAAPIAVESGQPFGHEWTLREDLPVFSNLEEGQLHAGLYQSKDRARLTFHLAQAAPSRITVTRVTLGFDPKYFFIQGTPVVVDAATGESSEIDYRFDEEQVIFETVKATGALAYVEFGVCSRKLRNRGVLTIEEKLKQSRTIRRIRQKTDSWSPLAEGQIIAQETLRPIICHGGYDPQGTKTSVVWANGGKLTGTFELLDAVRNRQHPAAQPVVYRGELKEAGFHLWGGNNYVADFSDFKREGLYLLRLRVKETKEVMDSYTFPIKKGRYLDLSKKAGRWFYYQRCGMEVPGFHGACHTQDAVIKTDGTRVDIAGGWHDAGDYGKWVWGGTMGLFALTMFQDVFGAELEETLGGMPRFINEAAWEADYFCKSYWDGMLHQGFTPDFEDVCTWLGAPDKEPPRVILEQETLEIGYGITKGPAICLTGAILARTARLVSPYDAELAERCTSVARDIYDRCAGMDFSQPEYEKYQTAYLYYILSGLLLADLELGPITGDRRYERDAIQKVTGILELQDEEGYFYSDRARTAVTADPGYHLPALYEFLRRNPESSLCPRIREAFGRWARYTMRSANLSPFGQIGGQAKDDSIRNIKPNTNNGRFGELAWGLATAGRLLGEPQYVKAAENQLQWILGFNPADISMMAGVGRGPGCYHTRYCFMEGCETGLLPGGITLGIVAGTGETIELGDMDTKNWVIAKVPIDYPLIDSDAWGWTYAYKTSEYALAKAASFIKAASQIEMALREMR